MPTRFTRSKFSLIDLVTDHYKTLRNYSTGRASVGDYMIYVAVPAACGILVAVLGARADNLPEVLSAAAILTGLIFNSYVLLFDLTMRVSDRTDPARMGEVMRVAGELRANISYAVLVGIVLTTGLGGVVMLSDYNELPIPITVSVVFLAAQLLLTIFMILKRIRALYRAFLVAAPAPVP